MRYASNKSDSLATKLEKLLDLILPQFGMSRIDVGEDIDGGSVVFSESSDSVDWEALDPSITLMENADDTDLRLQIN